MSLGPYAGLIISAYLLSIVVLVGAVFFTVTRAIRVKRSLAELEQRGVRRRSDARGQTMPAERPRPGTTA